MVRFYMKIRFSACFLLKELFVASVVHLCQLKCRGCLFPILHFFGQKFNRKMFSIISLNFSVLLYPSWKEKDAINISHIVLFCLWKLLNISLQIWSKRCLHNLGQKLCILHNILFVRSSCTWTRLYLVI